MAKEQEQFKNRAEAQSASFFFTFSIFHFNSNKRYIMYKRHVIKNVTRFLKSDCKLCMCKTIFYLFFSFEKKIRTSKLPGSYKKRVYNVISEISVLSRGRR